MTFFHQMSFKISSSHFKSFFFLCLFTNNIIFQKKEIISYSTLFNAKSIFRLISRTVAFVKSEIAALLKSYPQTFFLIYPKVNYIPIYSFIYLLAQNNARLYFQTLYSLILGFKSKKEAFSLLDMLTALADLLFTPCLNYINLTMGFLC